MPPEKPTFDSPRRFPRLKLDVSIAVFSGPAAAETKTRGRGNDIGEGGLAIYAPVEFGVGQAVRVEFTLPYSRMKFALQAMVRNKHGFRYGIEFVKLTAEQREELQRICGALQMVQ